MYYNTHNTTYIILEYKSYNNIQIFTDNKNNKTIIFNIFHHIVMV